MIWDGALAPSLRGIGLRLSMAPGLDGVMDIVVITDLVACGWMPRGTLVPLLLSGLGAPGPRVVGADARGVTTASGHRWGMRIGAIPIGCGHGLGWP